SSTTRITLGGRCHAVARLFATVEMLRIRVAGDGDLAPSGSKSLKSSGGNRSTMRTGPSACHQDESRTQCGFSAILRSCRVAQVVENAYCPSNTQTPSDANATPFGGRHDELRDGIARAVISTSVIYVAG